MMLDIDIRISNDEGTPVQRFTKHFDSKFDSSNITEDNNSIGKGFHEFLSEYLSGSGRLIRENLLAVNQQPQFAADSVAKYSGFNSSDYSAEVEYTLKLGNSQSITGSIPINKLFKLSKISNITEYNNTADAQDNIVNTDKEAVDFSNDLVLKRNNFKQNKPAFTLMEVDEMFKCFITNAVERYEDSFYVADYEQSSFIESS